MGVGSKPPSVTFLTLIRAKNRLLRQEQNTNQYRLYESDPRGPLHQGGLQRAEFHTQFSVGYSR